MSLVCRHVAVTVDNAAYRGCYAVLSIHNGLDAVELRARGPGPVEKVVAQLKHELAVSVETRYRVDADLI